MDDYYQCVGVGNDARASDVKIGRIYVVRRKEELVRVKILDKTSDRVSEIIKLSLSCSGTTGIYLLGIICIPAIFAHHSNSKFCSEMHSKVLYDHQM